ncbi:MAG TPA: hypothetical protein VHS96_03040 [Bacteroidia bacterium]|nr:hypothetical protein [Bacteroidia bacterium]
MRTFITLIVLAFGLSFAGMAQCGTNSLIKDCVGACGMSYTGTYTVTPSDVGPDGVGLFCLSATSNSLCPSHHAFATVQRNGGGISTANLDLGEIILRKGLVGDVFTITVDAVFFDPNINCVWLGETEFAFSR